MLNYKLRNNIGELGRNFGNLDLLGEGVKSNVFYPKPEEQENTLDELNDRKKAWAELERESQAVKHNIKSVMNKAHQATGDFDNNLMNDLFKAKTQGKVHKTILEEKVQQYSEKVKNISSIEAKSETQENNYKSKERLEK